MRDLPVFQFRTTVILELYRLRCPDCGPKIDRVEQLPSKAPFSKRFEEEVGRACEGAMRTCKLRRVISFMHNRRVSDCPGLWRI